MILIGTVACLCHEIGTPFLQPAPYGYRIIHAPLHLLHDRYRRGKAERHTDIKISKGASFLQLAPYAASSILPSWWRQSIHEGAWAVRPWKEERE